jgi:uncharacterized membrane protein
MEETKTTPTKSPRHALARYRIHWHVVFTHFPVSLFMVSAGFILLHLFTDTSCFERAGYFTLVAGTVMLVPTTYTGWSTWKKRYRGAGTKIFRYKIRISLAMIPISLPLVIWRSTFPTTVHTAWHGIYFGGFVLLFAGAIAEGYYGGRLNHR